MNYKKHLIKSLKNKLLSNKKLLFFSFCTIILIFFFALHNKKPIINDQFNNDDLLRICYINGIKPVNNAIDRYFTDRYRFKYVEKNCDVTISGPYNRSNLTKAEPNSVKIWYTGESRMPDISYWEKIKNLFRGKYIQPLFPYYDLMIGFNRIDHDKWVRYPYYLLDPGEALFTRISRPKCQPQKEYFACFLFTANGKKDGCKKRNEIFRELSKYKFVASGGKLFNNIGEIIPKDKTNEFLSKCKFIIASENKTYDGYITEKLPNAYIANSVPIYYGDIKVGMDLIKNPLLITGIFLP